MQSPANSIDPHARPIYWFALLDQALDEGDFETAADAVRQLATLGIQVKYGRPTPLKKGVTRDRT
jgi:hypothetical protein